MPRKFAWFKGPRRPTLYSKVGETKPFKELGRLLCIQCRKANCIKSGCNGQRHQELHGYMAKSFQFFSATSMTCNKTFFLMISHLWPSWPSSWPSRKNAPFWKRSLTWLITTAHWRPSGVWYLTIWYPKPSSLRCPWFRDTRHWGFGTSGCLLLNGKIY